MKAQSTLVSRLNDWMLDQLPGTFFPLARVAEAMSVPEKTLIDLFFNRANTLPPALAPVIVVGKRDNTRGIARVYR